MTINWRDLLQNLGVLLMFAVAVEGIAVQTYLVIQAERHSPPVIWCAAPLKEPKP